MSKGRYEHKGRHRRRKFGSKSLALVLACVLLVGGVIGGTLAWLTADGGSVTNTFTESDIEIKLEETKPVDETAPMVPGWTIEKDPKVTVEDGSEDCWLFVKITETTNPDLDAYIAYEIADKYDATTNPDGWQTIQTEDINGVTVIGRKVYKDDTTKAFAILGAGEYTDPMDADDHTDDFKITWGEDQVCVKPSVTEQMMEAIRTSKPTLSFQAYAVQLFKTNSDGNKANTDDEFTAAEAWARAADMTTP